MLKINLDNYDILLGEAWNELTHFINANHYSSLFVIVDENTKEFCLPILKNHCPELSFEVIQIESGEINKNIETCQQIWQQYLNAKADRKSLCINLGGGVIGDMGGFCASTFKRGMDFIQISTTLLAQVDASIGGKLGIDFGWLKNCIGLFQNPKQVFIHPGFLKSLPQRELRSGFAELIKHALIHDKNLWNKIKDIEDLQALDWNALLHPSLMVKKEIVALDPFEKGIRKALNFGHTIGHAIESHFLNQEKRLLHGEAIAIGMICEAYLSSILTNFSTKDLSVVTEYLLRHFGRVNIEPKDYETLISLMFQDKKNTGTQINCSLLNAIGSFKIDQIIGPSMVRESLNYYANL